LLSSFQLLVSPPFASSFFLFYGTLNTALNHSQAAEKEEWMGQLKGVAVSSDAFFPFRDNIDQVQNVNACTSAHIHELSASHFGAHMWCLRAFSVSSLVLHTSFSLAAVFRYGSGTHAH
jgi:hypothetical protein